MEVLKTIVSSTAEALGVMACSLRLLGPDGKHLLFGAAHGLSASYRAKGPVLVEHSGVDRLALAGRQPVYIANAQTDPRFQYPDQARDEGIAAVLVVPLHVQDHPSASCAFTTANPAPSPSLSWRWQKRSRASALWPSKTAVCTSG